MILQHHEQLPWFAYALALFGLVAVLSCMWAVIYRVLEWLDGREKGNDR